MTDQNHPRHPLDMNGKPMHDWYYTRDGLCRPVPRGTAPAETYKDYYAMFPDAKPERLPQWRIDEAIAEKRKAIAQMEVHIVELKRKLAYLESLSEANHR